jgi:uncharacterized protein
MSKMEPLALKGELRPGSTLQPWVDTRLEMRSSPISGRGLFAREPIRAGEPVIAWGGTVFSRAELLAGKANPETVAVLDQGLYLADPAGEPVADEYSLNHSCDSNLWMVDAFTLSARRAIPAGEELTADYALWLYEQDWSLEPCLCSASACRGKVTDRDWMILELQSRYAGHFSPFLNRLIARQDVPSPHRQDRARTQTG